jgi:hypothetical protein
MKWLFRQKNKTLLKTTARIVVGVFTLCMFTGFAQSINSSLSLDTHACSCCETTDTTTNNNDPITDKVHDGVCSTAKISSQADPVRCDFVANTQVHPLPDTDTQIHRLTDIVLTETHKPPLNLLTYNINAPPNVI